VKGRVARDESGFTLAEVLVAMVMMLTVMFALYSIFDMSLRVFSFGNDKTEAVENARIGLEKMEREVRAAYPEDKEAGNETLLRTGTDSDTIVFGNDTNGDHKITTSSPDEEITYDLNGSTLERNGQPAVENVSSLSFDYLDSAGNTTDPDDGSDILSSEAKIVKINLEINVDGRTQTLTTDVALRNR